VATEKDITPAEDSLDEEDVSGDGQDGQDIPYEQEEQNISDEDDSWFEDNALKEEGWDALDEEDIQDEEDMSAEEDIRNSSRQDNRSAPASASAAKTGENVGAKSRRLDKTVKETVNRLDDKERRYGFIASIVAAILWLVLTVPLLIHPAKPHKGQLGTEAIAIYLVVGLFLAGIIFFASWIKRRALLGFAVLFTGFSFGGDLLFAIPFYALGAWLIWRAMKVQREAQAAMQAAGATRNRPARARKPLFSRMAKRGESQQKKSLTGRSAPAASKRYTPPRSAAKDSRHRGK
jgi:hypothetical protein